MGKKLIIVESPVKAKTIEHYLGDDYQVASSNGHIRDLVKGNGAIDIDNGFIPHYEINPDKTHTVQQLKRLSKSADMVYLASDDDREGESISWHLQETLALPDSKTQRIVFHEITKSAILNALYNPRRINLDLVHSQQARRILDRIVGYDLSALLWKKIKSGLSAGRVQSVAVRIIVERERAIANFIATPFFNLWAFFALPTGQILKTEGKKKIKTEKELLDLLEKCKEASFTIEKLSKKVQKRTPAPPFITSTLQQEANRKLGYSVSRTMILAQQLYETGKISYMRTDSVTISEEILPQIQQEICNTYGEEYSHIRRFKTKSTTAQESHEAIRPTDFSVRVASNNKDAQRLYHLIWCRTVASQMSDAQIEKATATIAISGTEYKLAATGEILKFPGFLKVYSDMQDDKEHRAETTILPPLHVGETLQLDKMIARESFTIHPPRYTEASLVQALEEKEIGRPSTYAPIIATIQKRNYVKLESRPGKERSYMQYTLQQKQIQKEKLTEIVGADKKKLFPTDIAATVNDFLMSYFPNITDYGFTARMEEELDKIAHGDKIWHKMLAEFYEVFRHKVEEINQIDRTQLSKPRVLGVDPQTGNQVIVRLGRYGPVVQVDAKTDDNQNKPKFYPLRPNQRIDTITLTEALDLFKLPRHIGTYKDTDLLIRIGRYGPYIQHGNDFYALDKGDDPSSIDVDRCIELIEKKREKDKQKLIKDFPDHGLQILNGRWGPYIKSSTKNVRIPKTIETPENLTLEACLELLERAGKKQKATN